MTSRELLFYSDFSLGFHNPEAERKMELFAERGYRVTYVEQLGIRNPRPAHLARVLRRSLSRRHDDRTALPFAALSPKLLPLRRLPPVDRLNGAWLARQLLGALDDPERAVVWVRYPTPELVPLLESRSFGLVVYEAVDDHERAPGMTPRLRRAFAEAERRVLARAGVVFAWSEPIRRRLARMHANVVLAPAAVDPSRFGEAVEAVPEQRVAGYSGSLDFRFDVELVAAVAARLPQWRFDVAGPAEPEINQRLSALPNVRLLGRLAPAQVPGLMGASQVCLMPYRLTAFSENLFPIKLVEYLAAGRPVVSTPIPAARAFADVIELADDADAFATAVERAALTDAAPDRARRVERAGPYSWTQRIDEMDGAIRAALTHA